MPESIEVTLTTLHLNHKLRSKVMTDIEILGGRYSRHPLGGLASMRKAFPLTIKRALSKGKFMWFELADRRGNDYYLMNTYGMEGMWNFQPRPHSNVLFKVYDPKKKKKHTLYFTDQRNFGTLCFTTDRNVLAIKLQSMGEDLLRTPFGSEELYDRIEHLVKNKSGTYNKSKANKEIVKVLMDQTRSGGIGSGIGNYLASNILYKAGISPYKTLKEIYQDRDLVKKLSDAIKYEIKLAYMTEDVGYMDHLDPKIEKFVKRLRNQIKKNSRHKYNFHPDVKLGRNKFKFYVYRQKKDPKGNTVKRDVIIKGRGTYWSPTIQK